MAVCSWDRSEGGRMARGRCVLCFFYSCCVFCEWVGEGGGGLCLVEMEGWGGMGWEGVGELDGDEDGEVEVEV